MTPKPCPFVEQFRLTEGYGTSFAFAPDGSRWMSCYTGVGYVWEGNSVIREVPLPDWIDGAPAVHAKKGFFCGSTQIPFGKKAHKDLKKITQQLAPDGTGASRPAARILYTSWVIPGEQLLVSVQYTVPRNATGAPEYPGLPNRLLSLDVTGKNMPVILEEGFYPYSRIASGGQWIAAVSDRLFIWDAGGKKTTCASGEQTNFAQATGLQVCPNEKLIALGFDNGFLELVWGDSWKNRFSWKAHDKNTTAIAFHPELPILASAGEDGLIRLWDVENPLKPTLICSGAPIGSAIDALAFRPDGILVVASESLTGEIIGYSLPGLVGSN